MKLVRIALAVVCLPVAFLAIVVMRSVPVRSFWAAYWRWSAAMEEKSDG